MAPDKIYVPVIKPIFSKEQELYSEWKRKPLSLTIVKDNIEYIRKDALLEWARGKIEKVDADEGDFSFGYMSAMIGLIDKIEAM